MSNVDLQLPARRVLVGEIVTITPMEIELIVDKTLVAAAKAACDELEALLFRLPPQARRIVIPNELDEGAIELFPQPRLGASDSP